MTTDTPYGVTGCRCTPGIGLPQPDAPKIWTRNPHCPYHGILPRNRTDTGVYRVVGVARKDGTKDTHYVREPAETSQQHYPIWREVGWFTDGEDDGGEVLVCGTCVPKHFHYQRREDVPEWPCPLADVGARKCGRCESYGGCCSPQGCCAGCCDGPESAGDHPHPTYAAPEDAGLCDCIGADGPHPYSNDTCPPPCDHCGRPGHSFEDCPAAGPACPQCGDAGDCFVPAGHYRDCPEYPAMLAPSTPYPPRQDATAELDDTDLTEDDLDTMMSEAEPVTLTGPCGCPCDACQAYCEQCPPACAEGHTYSDGCRHDTGGTMPPRTDTAADDATPVALSPGGVTCDRCGWTMTGGGESERIKWLMNHHLEHRRAPWWRRLWGAR